MNEPKGTPETLETMMQRLKTLVEGINEEVRRVDCRAETAEAEVIKLEADIKRLKEEAV